MLENLPFKAALVSCTTRYKGKAILNLVTVISKIERFRILCSAFAFLSQQEHFNQVLCLLCSVRGWMDGADGRGG